MKSIRLPALLCLWLCLIAATAFSAPADPVGPQEKCPVCGMFVAKYEQWLSQIVVAGDEPLVFDGVKDMLAYYFNPPAYGGRNDLSDAEIWVRNYYTLEYIDGRTALYVVGSDVLGPMGDEFIPFSSEQEAENFKKDHQGSAIFRFAEINAAQVMEMKQKQMLKMKKMKGMKTQ